MRLFIFYLFVLLFYIKKIEQEIAIHPVEGRAPDEKRSFEAAPRKMLVQLADEIRVEGVPKFRGVTPGEAP